MLALLAQLAILADTLARMRTEQNRAAQAAGARQAAELIRAEHTRRLDAASAGGQQTRRAVPPVQVWHGRGGPGPRGAASRPLPLTPRARWALGQPPCH